MVIFHSYVKLPEGTVIAPINRPRLSVPTPPIAHLDQERLAATVGSPDRETAEVRAEMHVVPSKWVASSVRICNAQILYNFIQSYTIRWLSIWTRCSCRATTWISWISWISWIGWYPGTSESDHSGCCSRSHAMPWVPWVPWVPGPIRNCSGRNQPVTGACQTDPVTGASLVSLSNSWQNPERINFWTFETDSTWRCTTKRHISAYVECA